VIKSLRLAPYTDQQAQWPRGGRAILAQYDEQTIVVYQAYPAAVARRAAAAGRLDVPGFNLERTSWIKTSFLWMMRRSQWASAPNQEAVLAIWLPRPVFDGILAQAVSSSFQPAVYSSREVWQAALDASEVVVQWDPDYPPHGPKLARRAIQLGLRGETLRRCAQEWIAHIEDITGLVRQQAAYRRDAELLLVPAQRVYPVRDPAVARRLGLDKSVPT
jgi:hypothetical protein